MGSVTEEIEAELFSHRDEEYAKFQAKLTPGVSEAEIIGVRTPILRQMAKKWAKRADVGAFLDELPHRYYDENNLHGFIISEEKNYAAALDRVDRFLPFVNNWATCDLLSPKAFGKNRVLLKKEIPRWVADEKPFTVRFGIEMSMSHFLDEDFDESLLALVASVSREEYYVKMMVAWYFATALAKQWKAAVPYLENRVLERWTHNKTVQKAVESFRITEEEKAFLKKLKIK